MLLEISENNIVNIINILLGLYIISLNRQVPNFIQHLFDNIIFRISILFIIVSKGNIYPVLAIMIAISYILTFEYIFQMNVKKTKETIEKFIQLK